MSSVQIGEAFSTLIEDVSERVKNGGSNIIGLSTGFSGLDTATGGFRRKSFYFLGGPTGGGKTALALTMATHIARSGNKVWYASLEMPASLLALRILSGRTGIPAWNIERGLLTPDEFNLLRGAIADLSPLPFYVYDQTCNSRQLERIIKEHKEKNGLDFAVVDYLTLLTDTGADETVRLEKVVNRAHAIAVDCDIPLLGLGQLNRAIEAQDGNVPKLSNIRYSDRFAHDAFAVLFAHRPASFDNRPASDREDDAAIYIAKNRQGPKGKVDCTFYPKELRWEQRTVTPTDPPSITKGQTRRAA